MSKKTLADACMPMSSNIAQKDLAGKEGQYPIYGASGLIGFVDFYKQECQYIAVVKDGAGVGRVFCLPPYSSVIGTLQYLIPKEGVDVNYLSYAIQFMHLEKYYTGATIPHIYFKDYKREPLNLPALEAQQQIAETLGDVDEAIEILNELLSRHDDLVKSRFIEMFGDLETNPKGWKKTTFDDVSVKITDGEHATVPRVPDGYVFLNARNVLKAGKIDLAGVTFISEDNHNRIYKRCNPEPGDILLTTTGTIGNVAIVPKMEPFSMDRGITLIKQDRNIINGTFLAVAMRIESLQMHMRNGIHASAIGHLFMNKVKALPIFVPPIALQNQFADFVELADKSKLVIRELLEKHQLMKEALMQEYFG